MDLFGKRKKGYVILGLSMLLAWASAYEALGAEAGWVHQEDGWYYYQEDGNPARGWVESGGKSYYLLEGGRMFTGGVTPDGYYVGDDGAWYRRSETILGRVFTAPSRAASPGAQWADKDALTALKTVVSQGFSGTRGLKVTDNGVEYVYLEGAVSNSVSAAPSPAGPLDKKTDNGVVNRDNIDSILSGRTPGASSSSPSSSQSSSSRTADVKETGLMGLYKEPAQNRFRLDIRVPLDGDTAGTVQASSYDYAIFRAFAYQVSSVPELLADSIYSAWEAENRWGISRQKWVQVGDCLILYTSGNGYGRFYITPVQKGN